MGGYGTGDCWIMNLSLNKWNKVSHIIIIIIITIIII